MPGAEAESATVHVAEEGAVQALAESSACLLPGPAAELMRLAVDDDGAAEFLAVGRSDVQDDFGVFVGGCVNADPGVVFCGDADGAVFGDDDGVAFGAAGASGARDFHLVRGVVLQFTDEAEVVYPDGIQRTDCDLEAEFSVGFAEGLDEICGDFEFVGLPVSEDVAELLRFADLLADAVADTPERNVSEIAIATAFHFVAVDLRGGHEYVQL